MVSGGECFLLAPAVFCQVLTSMLRWLILDFSSVPYPVNNFVTWIIWIGPNPFGWLSDKKLKFSDKIGFQLQSIANIIRVLLTSSKAFYFISGNNITLVFKMNIRFLLFVIPFFAVWGTNAQETPVKKKLQIGIKKRVDDCKVKSKKGDLLHMHYRVSQHRPKRFCFWCVPNRP